jgi:hypothetical protein
MCFAAARQTGRRAPQCKKPPEGGFRKHARKRGSLKIS